MQIELWYPSEFLAVGVPFYIPVRVKVFEGSGDYSYKWSINNELLSEKIPYEAYSKENVCSIGFASVGILEVTCTVTDNMSGESITKSIIIEGKTVEEDGIYRFDQEPVAKFYDDRYSPDFSVSFKKRFESGDKFSGAYNYFIGAYRFVRWDPTYDYSKLTNLVRELVNRTLQPDQMWDRYFASDCMCQFSMKDPVDVYYPNKFILHNLFTSKDGIGYHIKILNSYPLYLATERLYQALSFACSLKGLDLKRVDYSNFKYATPAVYYDTIMNNLDTYLKAKYNEMKSIIDIDNMFELLQTETDTFLGLKSYENNLPISYWEYGDLHVNELIGDFC